MSYGLNVEMHKQVSLKLYLIPISNFRYPEKLIFFVCDFIFNLLLFALFLYVRAILFSKCAIFTQFCIP